MFTLSTCTFVIVRLGNYTTLFGFLFQCLQLCDSCADPVLECVDLSGSAMSEDDRYFLRVAGLPDVTQALLTAAASQSSTISSVQDLQVSNTNYWYF